MVVQESECVMKDSLAEDAALPSGTLAWKPEDMDAPKSQSFLSCFLFLENEFPIDSLLGVTP